MPRGLYLEHAGKVVGIEEALRDGFVVSPDDSPAVLTLALRFVETRDECAR